MEKSQTKQIRLGIVTGIPRSGTSLFSTLLNQHDNMVCINEILYDVNRLKNNLYDAGRRILDGKTIRNKFDASGSLTADTMKTVVVKEYNPRKSSLAIAVFSKVNVPYLMQLNLLIKLGIPIFIMVRDPVYCLASWGADRSTKIPEAMVGPDPNDIHKRYRCIAFSTDDRVERQAELWNFFAAIVIRYQPFVTLIKYEQLVNNTNQVLNTIFDRIGFDGKVIQYEVFNGNVNERYNNDFLKIKEAVKRYAPNRQLLGYG